MPQPPVPAPSLIVSLMPLVSPVMTWVLVITGWVVVNHGNNVRESRKETRSKIDAIIKAIDALETKSIKYYMTDVSVDAHLLEMEIKRDIKALEAGLKRLSLSDPHFQTADAQKDLQNSMTGGDFEQSARVKRPHTDGKLLQISTDARELINVMEIAYITKYAKKSRLPWKT